MRYYPLASQPDLPFLFIFFSYPKASLIRVSLVFTITTLLRVCPIPFFLFSQLTYTFFYFTNLLAAYILFFGGKRSVIHLQRYKLGFYTLLRLLRPDDSDLVDSLLSAAQRPVTSSRRALC